VSLPRNDLARLVDLASEPRLVVLSQPVDDALRRVLTTRS
jgi:hypothetical protein